MFFVVVVVVVVSLVFFLFLFCFFVFLGGFVGYFIRVKYSFRCYGNGRVFSGDGFQHSSSVTGV